MFVAQRENIIVNRLNKTKQEIEVDHEAEQVSRQKADSLVKKQHVESVRAAEKERQSIAKREKEARSYDRLFSAEAMEAARKEQPDEEDDDFFM